MKLQQVPFNWSIIKLSHSGFPDQLRPYKQWLHLFKAATSCLSSQSVPYNLIHQQSYCHILPISRYIILTYVLYILWVDEERFDEDLCTYDFI